MTTVQRRLAFAAVTATSTYVVTMLANNEVNRRPCRPFQGPGGSNTKSSDKSSTLQSLKDYGVGIVDDVLDQNLLREIQSTEVFQSMPSAMRRPPRHRRRGPPVAPSRPEDADLWPPSASGRYHRREEFFGEHDMEVFEQLEKKILPLVHSFFQEDEDGHNVEGIYRSEMQILNAVPGSMSQSWHSDNQSRGLTIIIPLVDFTCDNGPTQVLVGSHNGEKNPRSWLPVMQQGAQVIVAPVGSIAAYDSRIYHRGLGNSTDQGRPAIIFCYDRKWSPPPGIGTYGSILNSFYAGFLNIASTAWIQMFDDG